MKIGIGILVAAIMAVVTWILKKLTRKR